MSGIPSEKNEGKRVKKGQVIQTMGDLKLGQGPQEFVWYAAFDEDLNSLNLLQNLKSSGGQ